MIKRVTLLIVNLVLLTVAVASVTMRSSVDPHKLHKSTFALTTKGSSKNLPTRSQQAIVTKYQHARSIKQAAHQKNLERMVTLAAFYEMASKIEPPAPDPVYIQPEASAITSSGDVWECISIAETGGDPAMGETYWTEYGVIVDVIEDYGTPDEQAAIFNGTADAATRLAPVARFAADNGFGGWGELTKEKCGL